MAEICLFAGYDPSNHGMSGGLYAISLAGMARQMRPIMAETKALWGCFWWRCWINLPEIIGPRESQVPEFLSEYLLIAIFFAIAVGLSAAFVTQRSFSAISGRMRKRWPPTNVALMLLRISGAV